MNKRKHRVTFDQVAVCRICVVGDVRMHNVVDEKLQEIYQKLTSMPFETGDGRPSLVCYMCYDRLRKCYQFSVKCMETESMFTQMLSNRYKKKEIKLEVNSEPFKGFSVTPVIHAQFDYSVECGIKEELPDVSEQHDDDVQTGSPMNNTHSENIQNDLKNEGREDSTTHASVVRKRKLDKPKDNINNTAPTATKTTAHTVEKVVEDEAKETTSKPAIEKKIMNRNSKKAFTQLRIPNKESDIKGLISNHDKSLRNFSNKDNNIESLGTNKVTDVLNCKNKKKNDLIMKVTRTTYKSIRNRNNTEVCNTQTKRFTCDVCQYSSNLKCNLINHIRIHTGEKRYKCNICNHSFNLKSYLLRHVRTHTGEKPYKCDICEYRCSVKGNLLKHIRIHSGEKPYKCNMCEYSCKQKNHLVNHIRTHTSEKPYKCEKCEGRFKRKDTLVKHFRIHTGEKSYQCHKCEYKCYDKSNLVRHIRIHTGEKPYKCEICDYSCNQSCSLVKHIRIHTGEKPYKCNICKLSLNRKSGLIKHIRIHTGEKPYTCDICEYRCSVKSSLVQHIRIHTGEKPYKCNICEYSCSNSSGLSQHIRKHMRHRM